jgi:hypothetical protein
MAEVTFQHLDALLGTDVEHEHTLGLTHLIELASLDNLDAPFGANEIWDAIKLLPARKALVPDGFTAQFIYACWCTVREDFINVFP